MLKKALLTKEISVTVVNKIGVLDIMAGYLADRGINIEAIAGYEMPGSNQATIMLVVDNTLRATEAIKERDFGSIEEHDVILVELDNKPGALKTVTGLLALKGINIRYIYATTSLDKCPVRVILSTSDNQAALITLKKSAAK
ncbi:MAG TPA: ACT domain-containing protein [Syntrophales bacterium]|nr:ACT domain-containing protein [Syntrophales bacterium]